ncbi:hypothetical protein SAMCFNEI73_Ch2538 [Sinorhizobium americanum]|uniref:Uncharacterized protein n=1 Tax=Sinorhizobium americanum TaxID=194963 RepID=A0A1L3LP38_9HYPH|nr:hypothetical protein SAMCFNEI73_Ch2538 [Sinorhizobium americanum]
MLLIQKAAVAMSSQATHRRFHRRNIDRQMVVGSRRYDG